MLIVYVVHPHVKQDHALGLVACLGCGWAELVGSNPPLCFFSILFLGPLTYGPTSQPTFCSSGLRFFSRPTRLLRKYEIRMQRVEPGLLFQPQGPY